MLKDTGEAQKKKCRKSQKHRSLSREEHLNPSPLSNISERSEKRHRSSTRKRPNSIKQNKEEIKYQRFVRDLTKDVRVYLNNRLRETRFDPSGKEDPANNFTFKSKHLNSALRHYTPNESTATTTTTSTENRRPRSRKSRKNNDIQRLTADVHNLLTGPSFKSFYNQFIHPRQRENTSRFSAHPLDESIVLPND